MLICRGRQIDWYWGSFFQPCRQFSMVEKNFRVFQILNPWVFVHDPAGFQRSRGLKACRFSQEVPVCGQKWFPASWGCVLKVRYRFLIKYYRRNVPEAVEGKHYNQHLTFWRFLKRNYYRMIMYCKRVNNCQELRCLLLLLVCAPTQFRVTHRSINRSHQRLQDCERSKRRRSYRRKKKYLGLIGINLI